MVAMVTREAREAREAREGTVVVRWVHKWVMVVGSLTDDLLWRERKVEKACLLVGVVAHWFVVRARRQHV